MKVRKMKNSIFDIFNNLQQRPIHTDFYSVASLPFSKKHKIGISHDGFPLFFISCNDVSPTIDINLEKISVQFYCSCKLYENSIQTENIYSIISLKTKNTDFQKYFIEIIILIIKKLSDEPSHKQLKIEIEKLVHLFSKFSQPPRKTIQGLWAELLVIEQSQNPEYLIRSWHTSPKSKFDFNDGKDKIEVKSTSKSRRIHNFSAEQLSPNEHSDLWIASVFVIESGQGKNIFDLLETISKRVKNNELRLQLNGIIFKTLGDSLENAFETHFDYQQACDTLIFYDYKDIPTIDTKSIPKEISNIRFDVDLSQCKSLKNKSINSFQSLIFKSIKL